MRQMVATAEQTNKPTKKRITPHNSHVGMRGLFLASVGVGKTAIATALREGTVVGKSGG
jgi:hypothetical protein